MCYFNHPNIVFYHIIKVLLISLICHTPIVIRGQHVMSETTSVGVSNRAISECVLAQWWPSVAFMKATNLLY